MEVTLEALAVKLAVEAPDGTVIEEGTVTLLLLLDSETASPPLPAAAVSETEQEVETAPVKELLLQLSPLRAAVDEAAPVPESATVVKPPDEALVARVIAPVEAPVAVGANLTCNVAA